MLGYRSFFTVDRAGDASPVTGTVLAQVHAWLRSKKYDADLVVPGRTVEVGAGVEATLATEIAADGSESALLILEEKRGTGGTWTTQLIVHEPHRSDRQAWVWLDVVAPDTRQGQARWTAVPNLAGRLLEVVDARDGGALLDPRISSASAPEVDELIAALVDPARRGPVFVAGSDESLPMQPWRQLVGSLLKQTTGLAAGYVLDPEATALFAERVGATHLVSPGTMRTFLPGVSFGDDFDARRHRVLTTQTILRDEGQRIVRVLGMRARETTLDTPVPRSAVRVEERLFQQVDRDILAAVDHPRAVTVDAADMPPDDAGRPRKASTAIGPSTPAPIGSEPRGTEVGQPSPSLVGIETHLALVAALQEVLGRTEPTVEAISALADEARRARGLATVLRRREEQLTHLTATVTDLRDQVEELNRQLEDEQTEHALTADGLRDRDALVRALRRRLQQTEPESAWAPLSADEQAAPVPTSFGELLERLPDLQHVVWTGADANTEFLDARNPLGEWAAKAWSALLALEDYAAERLAGRCPNVESYLKDTPGECHGYPANRHARDESEDVKSNPKYATPRMLPVPATVDPNTEIFMGAHFKIAQSGTISPRLHYHDAVSVDGHVYVGYIGRHLPTQKTN